MSIISKATIKTNFEDGDHPNQDQFEDLIDSAMVPISVSQTYSSTVNTDASVADLYRLTLTGDVTIANPTSAVDGKVYTWEITQSTGSPHSITLGNKFILPASASALAWSDTIGLTDVLAVRYNQANDKYMIIAMIPGYTL